MEQIQNQVLTVKSKKSGAELTSIVKDGIEYLWQADASVWARHAPNLFPIIGKLNNNTYKVGNESYQLGSHGFARDSEFQLVSKTENSVTYQLSYTEETLLKYPFKFELYISYTIQNDSLTVTYEVKNVDSKDIIFAMGGHPAFNCPLLEGENFEDYQLVFEKEEPILTRLVDLSNGLISSDSIEVKREGNKVNINTELFDMDALVLKNLKSEWVGIIHKTTGKGVKMNIAQFPLLGIWAKANTKKFVCLEPWQGLADHQNYEGQFAEKEEVVVLKEKETWKATYEIIII